MDNETLLLLPDISNFATYERLKIFDVASSSPEIDEQRRVLRRLQGVSDAINRGQFSDYPNERQQLFEGLPIVDPDQSDLFTQSTNAVIDGAINELSKDEGVVLAIPGADLRFLHNHLMETFTCDAERHKRYVEGYSIQLRGLSAHVYFGVINLERKVTGIIYEFIGRNGETVRRQIQTIGNPEGNLEKILYFVKIPDGDDHKTTLDKYTEPTTGNVSLAEEILYVTREVLVEVLMNK